jgi:phage terminase Nu1 subunit (DNA packaging protein)
MVSINELAELTGRDRRTIKKRLADLPSRRDGRSILFDSGRALSLIYGATADDGQALDPSQERAALDRARRRLAELQHAEQSRELIPAGNIKAELGKAVHACRSHLLALPVQLAGRCVNATSQEVQNEAKALVHHALDELSHLGNDRRWEKTNG